MFEPHQISHIADFIKAEKIGIFPTDTLWGLTAISSETTRKKLNELKNRPPEKDFIQLIPNTMHLEPLTANLTEFQKTAIQKYWPGPTTLILPGKTQPTIAIRYPDFPPLNCLLNCVGHPLLSSSVNKSNTPEIKKIEEIDPEILNQIDFLFKGVIPLLNKPSTIIDITQGEEKIIR